MTENGNEPDPWAPLGEEKARALATVDADLSGYGELKDILDARTLLGGWVVSEMGKPPKHEFLEGDCEDGGY